MDPADSPPDTPAGRKRQVSTLAAIIVAVATPATVALSYYRLTGDPTFRPLAVTVERLTDFGIPTHDLTLRAAIRFDEAGGGRPAAVAFARMIHEAFYAKGVGARVTILPDPGHVGPPTVTLEVLSNSYGPFPPDKAAAGVELALRAYQLKRPWHEDEVAREHRW